MWRNFIVSPRHFAGTAIGNLLLGIGIGIFKYSNMGNDPFTAMVLSVHRFSPFSYALFLICLNTFIFLFEVKFGKKYIGIGTMINWFLLGYVVQYSIVILEGNLPVLSSFLSKFLVMLIGVIIASFGLSLYQTADVGVAPYDSLALMVEDHLPIPYFWARIFFDGVCALVAYLTGGLIGLGTLVCAFGLGPVVTFFNRMVTEKLMPSKEAINSDEAAPIR